MDTAAMGASSSQPPATISHTCFPATKLLLQKLTALKLMLTQTHSSRMVSVSKERFGKGFAFASPVRGK